MGFCFRTGAQLIAVDSSRKNLPDAWSPDLLLLTIFHLGFTAEPWAWEILKSKRYGLHASGRFLPELSTAISCAPILKQKLLHQDEHRGLFPSPISHILCTWLKSLPIF